MRVCVLCNWSICVFSWTMRDDLTSKPIFIHTSARTFLKSNLLAFSLIRGQIIGQTWLLAIINVSQEMDAGGKKDAESEMKEPSVFSSAYRAKQGRIHQVRAGRSAQCNIQLQWLWLACYVRANQYPFLWFPEAASEPEHLFLFNIRKLFICL